MINVDESVVLTKKDFVEAIVFSAVYILGLPASIFLAMAIAG